MLSFGGNNEELIIMFEDIILFHTDRLCIKVHLKSVLSYEKNFLE